VNVHPAGVAQAIDARAPAAAIAAAAAGEHLQRYNPILEIPYGRQRNV
jgi:hypothetical protein